MRTSGAWLQTSGGSSCSASHWSPCLFLGLISFFGLNKKMTVPVEAALGRRRRLTAPPLSVVIHMPPGWMEVWLWAWRTDFDHLISTLMVCACRYCARASGSRTASQEPLICCRRKPAALSDSKWLKVQNGLNWWFWPLLEQSIFSFILFPLFPSQKVRNSPQFCLIKSFWGLCVVGRPNKASVYNRFYILAL